MDGVTFVHVAIAPMVLVYLACSAVLLVLTVWALVEAVRARTWRWVFTILLLEPIGAFAWFVAGRRFYRHPAKRWRGWITEAPSAGRRPGESRHR